MKILAIDTATEACSVALLLDDKIVGTFEICPQQHSQKVLPMVDDLLKQNSVVLADLDAIAYGRGPGSFTGVRIATGIAQGLSFGADLPVVEVSTLAAMAQEAFAISGQTDIRVLIDARMQEVYFGDYRIENGIAVEKQDEGVMPPHEALAKFSQISDDKSSWVYAGTGWQAYSSELDFDNKVTVMYPNASAMLPIAKKAVEEGRTINAEHIQPTYLRDKVTWKKLPHKE